MASDGDVLQAGGLAEDTTQPDGGTEAENNQHVWIKNTIGIDPSKYPKKAGKPPVSAQRPAAIHEETTAASEEISVGDSVVQGRAAGGTALDASNSDDAVLPAAAAVERGPPAENLDPGEGKNDDGSVRKKAGKGGKFRGRESKNEQDHDVDDAVRDFGLDKEERKQLHKEVGGRDLERDEIRRIAQDIVSRRTSDSSSPSLGPIIMFLAKLGIEVGVARILAIIIIEILTGIMAAADLQGKGLTNEQIRAVGKEFNFPTDGIGP